MSISEHRRTNFTHFRVGFRCFRSPLFHWLPRLKPVATSTFPPAPWKTGWKTGDASVRMLWAPSPKRKQAIEGIVRSHRQRCLVQTWQFGFFEKSLVVESLLICWRLYSCYCSITSFLKDEQLLQPTFANSCLANSLAS